MTRPKLQLHSAPMRTTGADRDGLDNSQYGGGNIRTPMRVWLSEALTRSRNYMESLDDYTYASWRGHNSFDDARNSGTRASSYPRARRLRRLPFQRRFRNWIYATSATRSSCCWSRNGRRCGMAASLSPETAHAQEYPWCVSRESYLYCFYKTQEQCQWAASGIGGCALNPRLLLPDKPRDSNASATCRSKTY
jgi:Protein of unknown function (DUF3551)